MKQPIVDLLKQYVEMKKTSPRTLIAYVSRAGENCNVGVTDPDSASAVYAGYAEKGIGSL